MEDADEIRQDHQPIAPEGETGENGDMADISVEMGDAGTASKFSPEQCKNFLWFAYMNTELQ